MDYLGNHFALGIVDNDELTILSLKNLISKRLPYADMLWTTSRGIDAVRNCCLTGMKPDVLLVDMSLEDMSGIDVCRRIRAATDKIMLIAITSFSIQKYQDVLYYGAQCLLDKVKVRDICTAACLLANGREPNVGLVSKESACESHARLSGLCVENDAAHHLSKREDMVISLCAQGRTSGEIGKKLGLKETTVKTYIKRVMVKYGAKNRTQAVAQWLAARQ